MDINAFAEHLLQRLDQARVMRHQPEGLVVGVGGESGARRAGLLAPDLLAIAPENLVRFAAQNRDLLFGEAVREKHVTLLVEGLDLFGCEVHGVLPGTVVSFVAASSLAASGAKITRLRRRMGGLRSATVAAGGRPVSTPITLVCGCAIEACRPRL